MALVWSNLQECFSSPLIESENNGLSQPDNWLHFTQNQTQLGPGDPRLTQAETNNQIHPGRGFESPYQEFTHQDNATLLPHQVAHQLPSHALGTRTTPAPQPESRHPIPNETNFGILAPRESSNLGSPTPRESSNLGSPALQESYDTAVPQPSQHPVVHEGCSSCAPIGSFSTPIASLPKHTTPLQKRQSVSQQKTINGYSGPSQALVPSPLPSYMPTQSHYRNYSYQPQRGQCNDEQWMIALIIFVGTFLLLACRR